ncbi:hypothetical protein CEP53_004012 [Fusarium sp. AF-6]|nr:hypothetical protein CEP53_004012 [Fusarium sp. AF-6]
MSKETTDGVAPRVWQACVTCRRKKIKCDGNNPCHNCGSRHLTCEYPGSNDNASSSRSYATLFEARFQQLDTLCLRLEAVTVQLTRAIEKLPSEIQPSPRGSATTELEHVSQHLQSLLNPPDSGPASGASHTEFAPSEPEHDSDAYHNGSHHRSPDPETEADLSDESVDLTLQHDPSLEVFGSLVPDSYGKLRFIGGASNELLIKSIQSLTIENHPKEPEPATFAMSVRNEPAPIDGNPSVEVPLFIQGLKWRELPYLPKPDDLNLPPRYIADMLIGLYFDQLHYTFPVLFKPHFMDRYNHLYVTQKQIPRDREFLSVFFAVCACASGLIASGNQSAFPGLEFYEKALLLHFSTTGQASVERTQCLALVSMCCSGWNTLSSSWHFAGQAVRAAQDLGMHLSNLTAPPQDPTRDPVVSLLEAEVSRRIWWSIYCLDRVTSVCLGRPTAANDSDCSCALPRSILDEELVAALGHSEGLNEGPASSKSPLSGFLAFTQLCQISSRIQHLQAPARLASLNSPQGRRRMVRSANEIEKSLDDWLDGLPDEIRFSANTLDRGPTLTMSILVFVIHAGSLLNLYRTFSNDKQSFSQLDPVKNCISAARSCINAAELVRDFVPPSHYLALSVHCLTISGLALLWMKDPSPDKPDPDVEKCVRFLHDLEGACSGASKGRAIIEQTLGNMTRNRQGSSLDLDLQFSAMLNSQMPDLFSLESSVTGCANFWGTL